MIEQNLNMITTYKIIHFTYNIESRKDSPNHSTKVPARTVHNRNLGRSCSCSIIVSPAGDQNRLTYTQQEQDEGGRSQGFEKARSAPRQMIIY